MRKTKFKALMHSGLYVDTNILSKGIYGTSKPSLYESEATIEDLVKRGETLKDITGNGFIPESYFINLKECELVDVTLTVH